MEKPRFVSLLLVLMFLFVVAACFMQPALSQSSAIMKVETPSTSASVGVVFTVSVTLTNVQNLYGVEVNLRWNPTVLQVVNIDTRLGVESYADGVLHESSGSPPIFVAENNLTQNIGEYRLVGTSMAPALPFSGSGTVVKITFNPISAGNSVLDLESELSDYPPTDRDPRISLPIEHTTQDSSIVVTQGSSSQSPTPQPSDQPTSTPTSTATPQQQANPDIKLVLILVPVLILVVPVAIVLLFRKRKKG